MIGGLRGVEGVQAETFQHMTDERGRVTMNELLVFFKDAQATRNPGRTPVFSSGIATLALLKDGGAARESPVLLTTQLVLFCSPRDNGKVSHALLIFSNMSRMAFFMAD